MNKSNHTFRRAAILALAFALLAFNPVLVTPTLAEGITKNISQTDQPASAFWDRYTGYDFAGNRLGLAEETLDQLSETIILPGSIEAIMKEKLNEDFKKNGFAVVVYEDSEEQDEEQGFFSKITQTLKNATVIIGDALSDAFDVVGNLVVYSGDDDLE